MYSLTILVIPLHLALKKLPLILGKLKLLMCFKLYKYILLWFVWSCMVEISIWISLTKSFADGGSFFQWRLDNLWHPFGSWWSSHPGNCRGRTSLFGSWVWWVCSFKCQWSRILPFSCSNCKPINYEFFRVEIICRIPWITLHTKAYTYMDIYTYVWGGLLISYTYEYHEHSPVKRSINLIRSCQ